MTDKLDEQQVLDRYRRAYVRANGKDAPHIRRAAFGWYTMPGYGAKRRLKDFVMWSERLEARDPAPSLPLLHPPLSL